MADTNTNYFVYAIGIDGQYGGLELAIKIGVAKNPQLRLDQLQTGAPVNLILLKAWHFDTEAQARGFEKSCHKHFRDRNIKLEWFLVSLEDIDEHVGFFDAANRSRDEFDEVVTALGNLKASDAMRAAERRAVDRKIERQVERMKARASVDVPQHDFLNTKEAAAYIRKSVSWLNKSRMTGTGPAFVRNGGTVLYVKVDLDSWLFGSKRTAIYDFNNQPA
ncbi:T5orf172 domain-containing protein [Rhizobium sp. NFR07]|uniref:GIY-YIG nuclease family protein n=1 Tax=Rhizobium sp. NFR07 TaxID=1566262 RepID=UPI0008EFF54A|nr:GIY-YIG nuclease family protein [Rhizobium sp. NFR07]SFB52677.1 T5orf172 domain-containing protein [Rhizobium sp. NFR07]